MCWVKITLEITMNDCLECWVWNSSIAYEMDVLKAFLENKPADYLPADYLK